MAGGKETPRQKMVGMMYLVLMALLAINVSKSILDAFVTSDDQVLTQNKRLVESINGINSKISLLKNDPQSKKTAMEIEPIVGEIAKLANATDDHFLAELNALFALTENNGSWFTKNDKQVTEYKDLELMEKKDDYDTPSRLFAGSPGTPSDKRGKELLVKLEKLRDDLILKVAGRIKDKGKVYVVTENNLKSKEEFEKYLTAQKHPQKDNLMDIYNILTKEKQVEQHHVKKDWNVARFYHQPMVGVVGTFTSLRNDIRLAQQKAAKMLMERVDVPMMNINKVEAQVLASTQYLNLGDELDLKVGIVAYDSSKVYTMEYQEGESGKPVMLDSNSMKIKASSPGVKKLQGYLNLEIAGEKQKRPWSFEYTVGKPNASVALPDLNVLYRGYPNKVKAIASGYPPSEVKVSCSGCSSFSKSKGDEYIAKVKSGKKATVTVKAGGKTVGSQEFRIFSLPDPQPFFMGKSAETSVISSGSASIATKLVAKLPNSPLNVQYSVKSFELSAVNKGKFRNGGKSNGSSMTGQMKGILKGLKKGDKLYIESVKVAGPDGVSRKIPGLSFKIK